MEDFIEILRETAEVSRSKSRRTHKKLKIRLWRKAKRTFNDISNNQFSHYNGNNEPIFWKWGRIWQEFKNKTGYHGCLVHLLTTFYRAQKQNAKDSRYILDKREDNWKCRRIWMISNVNGDLKFYLFLHIFICYVSIFLRNEFLLYYYTKTWT